jgi:hypothetical protein
MARPPGILPSISHAPLMRRVNHAINVVQAPARMIATNSIRKVSPHDIGRIVLKMHASRHPA